MLRGSIDDRSATRLLQYAALASLFSLIALTLSWELWLAPLRPGGSWLALKAVPLGVPLGGIVRGKRYTYKWTTMLIPGVLPRRRGPRVH
jgi:uncharacterized membrane protein